MSPTFEPHSCLANRDLLHLFLGHLRSPDLIRCLAVSKLWNQIASHHLWSSDPLLIPSRKSDVFLGARLLEHTKVGAGDRPPNSSIIISPIRALTLNLSALHKNSLFVNARENFDLGTTFPSLRTLTLVNSLLLSPFLLVPLPKQDRELTPTLNILAHRSHKQRLRQNFYHHLVKQIVNLNDLAHLNLINFVPTSAFGPTPNSQETTHEADVHNSHPFNVNDLLLALADGFGRKVSENGATFRRAALKTLNITKSKELSDISLAALSEPAPLYDTYQHRQLSFDLTSLTLIECPLVTHKGFMSFLRHCPNLNNLRLGQMTNLFQPLSHSEALRDDDSKATFSGTSSESGDAPDLVGQLARYCPQLCSLSIEDITVSLAVSTQSATLPINVKKLAVSRCSITPEFLTAFSALSELRLNHCHIDDPSTRDYDFMVKSFRKLQVLSITSAGARSLTFANLDTLLTSSVELRTLIVDGSGRAARSKENETAPEAPVDGIDVLTESLAVGQHVTPLGESLGRESNLPADVLSAYGSYDILASQVPSNVLVFLLSTGRALGGVGLFGRADEGEGESHCVAENPTPIPTSSLNEKHTVVRLDAVGKLWNRVKSWFGKGAVEQQPFCEVQPFPPTNPEFKRSRTFWLHEQSSSPNRTELCAQSSDLPDFGGATKISKRLMDAEIKLLKSKCPNLTNVWI